MTVTAAGMRAFRSAATLVDVLPRARVQVKDGDRTLLAVSRTPCPEETGAEGTNGVVMHPGPFRCAVARAYQGMIGHGARFRFLDLPEGYEPTVHVALPAGDAVLPGHIYRARASEDQDLFLFVSGLCPEDCHEAIASALDPTPSRHPLGAPDGLRRRVGFHHDGLTELTVVHALAADRDRDAARLLMGRLLEICVAAEMVADIEAAPPQSRGIAP